MCELDFGIEELRKNQEGRITWAKDVGLTQMLVPTLAGPKQPTMDDVKRAADEYNKMGEESAKAGIQQGLHNEDFELTVVDGKRTYDFLFELLDPKLVKFIFRGVVTAADRGNYFMKYPGRFISMHVQGWSGEANKIMPVGQDSLEENLYRSQDRGHKKLLRRNEAGHDESQRPLPSQTSGLTSLFGHSTQKIKANQGKLGVFWHRQCC